MKTLIYEKPSLASLPNRIGWTFFTTIFWIFWIYLWMPIITVFFWWLGIHAFDHYFIDISLIDFGNLKHLLLLYSGVVIFLGGSLLAWAGTEFLRYRHIHRRLPPLPVERVELANFMHTSTEKLGELNSARRLVVHHDEHGKWLNAEMK